MQFRQLITFIFICAALCIVMQPVAAAIDNATSYYNAAEYLLQNGEFQRAVNLFDKALTENTTMMEKSGTIIYIYSDKAGALLQLERYDEALTTADQGLAIDNTYPVLWNNKGYALYKLGRYQEAIDAYDKAIRKATSIKESLNQSAHETDSLVDSLPKYLTNKGNALYESGRYQEAVDTYTKALTEDPAYTRATEGLARAQQKAPSIPPVMIIAVIAIVAVGGGAAYYVLKRKPTDDSTGKKKGKEK